MEKETKKKAVKKVENKETKKSTTTKTVKKTPAKSVAKPVAKKATTKATTTPTAKKTSTKTEKKAPVKKEVVKKTTTKTSKIVAKKEENINTNTREIDLTELREIIKEEKATAVRIPDVRGMSVEAAKDKLLALDIEYNDDIEKEYSLRIKAGRVTRTKPEANSLYDKTKKVTIYESRNKLLLLFIMLALLAAGIFGLTYGKDILDSINEQILHIGSKPAIDVDLSDFKDEKGKPIWTNTNIIKINKTNSKVKKYKYCISKDKSKDKCDWQETTIPNILIPESGHLYITIIPVDENGVEGTGRTVEVYIDVDAPKVDDLEAIKVTKDSIQVKTTVSDRDSGIEGYYYSLNGMDYTKDLDTHIFKNLKPDTLYTIYVYILDNAGNKTELSIKVKTLKENSNEDDKEEETKPIYEIIDSDDEYITLNLYYPIGSTDHEWTIDMAHNDWKEYTGPIKIKISDLENLHIRYTLDGKTYVVDKNGNIVELINGSVNGPDDRKDGLDEEVIEWDMPKISLEEVPSVIEYGESYTLPSSFDFGNDTGEVICLAEGNVYNDTKKLKPGKHIVECTAISSHEKYVTVTKEVKVEVKPGEEEVWNGFIKLNLYYPEGSYNWQWRLDGVNGIRTGYNGDDWQDYTGPILVKLEDVENIYIRYDMEGKTYIIAPNGRLAVDIEPEKWTINTGETTKVKIYYQEGTSNQKFRLNGGSWQDYTGEFNVVANTLIEAKCEKDEKVYDSNGDYQYTKTLTGMDNAYVSLYVPDGEQAPSGPSGVPITTRGGSGGGSGDGPSITTPGPGAKAPQSLAGPNIISAPSQELAQGVTVVITTDEEAEAIYYKEKNGAYKKYTGPFEVFENERISAYYVRKSDGVKSLVTYYYVDNIYEEGLPYVKISANPNNYLTEVVNSVEVTISGQNYDTLEYSFDGVLYKPYTNALIIKESTTIYAKGKNSLGETIETLDIKTPKVAIKPANDISINISTNPSSKDITGLVNKTTVSISYDSKAINKYYSINGGSWKEYTGPFELTENATIDAYATGDNAVGEASLSVDFLTTGIAAPVIKPNTTSKAYQVLVTIDYAKTANIKQYKLGTGVWKQYTGPFYVTENTIVYAKNEDELGNITQSSKIISNVMTGPEYTILDKGTYYLLKLNYPDVSDPSAREYKWKENGAWKTYDNAIVLVKPEYKDDVLEDGKDQVQVEDYSGDTILVDKEHVYIIDCPLDEIYENIFMRWANEKPQAPLIVVNPTDPAKEVEVSITYADSLIDKLYKVVYEDGTDTGWLDYTVPFKIYTNNAVVYAKGKNRLEVDSNVANTKITNIDDVAPSIEVKGDLENPKYNVVLTVSATDNIMMNEVKYAKGSHDIDYFSNDGTNIANNSQVTIEENGVYTIYAIDQAGNETVKEVEVTNVDKTEPNIIITVLTNGVKSQVEVAIDYGDSVTKEYSFDGVNYQSYPATGNLMLSAYDLFDKKNPDGTLTLYAKGTKSTGVSNEVSEKIYNLDLDKIAAPVIHANTGYPILTEYGVKYDDNVLVTYDQTRDDIINEISLDGGTTWKVYTGLEHVQSGTIKARSTNPVTGLQVQSSKTVNAPSDALGINAYDNNTSTYVETTGTKRIKIDESLWNHDILLNTYTPGGATGTSSVTVKYYDSSATMIGNSTTISSKNNTISTKVRVPENAVYADLVYANGGQYSITYYARINEIRPAYEPVIISSKVYPKIAEYGVEVGYDNVTINYYSSAVTKQYKIGDGEWKQYTGTVKLLAGQVITGRSIDKYGTITPTSSYTAAIPNDALGPTAYDGDTTTSFQTTGTRRIDIDESIWNHDILLDTYTQGGDSGTSSIAVLFYDENGNKLGNTTTISKKEAALTTKVRVPENAAYANLVYTNGSQYSVVKYARINEIRPWYEPVITSSKVHPKITEYGVEVGYDNVTVTYYSTAVTKQYKVGSGEWQDYTGVVKLLAGQVITVRSIDKNGTITPTTSYTAAIPSDALGPDAYDGNTSTYVQTTGTRRIDIDESIWNHDILLNTYTQGGDSGTSSIAVSFYDGNGSKLGNTTTISKKEATLTTKVRVPENAVYANLVYTNGSQYSVVKYARINEIRPWYEPVISSSKVHPKIYEYGVEVGYDNVTINYYSTAVTKQYKVGSGEWQDYTGVVKLLAGQVITARSIDENGTITPTSSYTAAIPSTALEPNGYDGNTSTTVKIQGTRRIDIDDGLWGSTISLNTYTQGGASGTSSVTVSFYNSAGTAVGSSTKISSKNNTITTKVTVPTNAAYAQLVFANGSQYSIIYNAVLNEIGPTNVKILTAKYTYPKLTFNGFEAGYYTASLHKKADSQKALYSLDNGDTWLEDNGSFIVTNDNKTVQAKEVLSTGNDSAIQSTTFKPKTDEISTNVTTISASSSKQFIVDKNLAGSKLRIYSNNEPASNANVKIYDKNNNLVDTYNFSAKVAVIDVKDNTYKVVVSSGSSELEIIDINSRTDDINVNTNIPTISTNTSDWTLTKIVNIIYPIGFNNEYSLDRGTTWLPYEDVIIIDKPTTILARVIDNDGNVITSSSYRITKIDTTEPTVSIDIDDTIVLGDSNSLPTSFVVDNTKSGGSASCKVGDEPITNTSSLTAGEHTITCTVTTGVGKTGTAEKTVKVLDKYEITFDYQAEGINNTTKLVVEGTGLGTLPTATRTNYVFDGWYTSTDYDTEVTKDTIPTGPTTYYAKWKAEYTIIFDYQVDGINNVSRKVVEGNSLGTLPTTTRTDYTLVGWFTSDDVEITGNTIPTGNTTYYAKWSLNAKPLGQMILEDNEIKTIGSNDIRTSSNNTSNQPGLYSYGVSSGYGGQYESGTTYFFRGNVQNNKVKFANLDWRVVRINENGTVRLILDGSIDNNTYPYNASTEAFYELAYYRQSQVKTTLNSWFNANIKGTNANKVDNGRYYCESARVKINEDYLVYSASMSYYPTYIVSLMSLSDANGTSDVSAKIGLITYDEVVFAGGYPEKANSDYYLKQNYKWYTMSPAGSTEDNTEIYIWSVSSDGSLNGTLTTEGARLRPVINLKADTKVKKDENGVYVVQ